MHLIMMLIMRHHSTKGPDRVVLSDPKLPDCAFMGTCTQPHPRVQDTSRKLGQSMNRLNRLLVNNQLVSDKLAVFSQSINSEDTANSHSSFSFPATFSEPVVKSNQGPSLQFWTVQTFTNQPLFSALLKVICTFMAFKWTDFKVSASWNPAHCLLSTCRELRHVPSNYEY